MAGLAELLLGQKPIPVPTPQGQPVGPDGQPVRGQTESKLGQLRSNPQFQAFMLNTIANLLTQQGIAASLGRGMEGVGRYQKAQTAADAQREQDTYARQSAAASASMAASKGSGGGGGGKAKDPAGDLIKRRDELFKLRGGDELEPGPERDQALAEAMTLALAEKGDRTAYDFYQSLTPENRVAAAPMLMDPYSTQTLLQEYSTAAEAAGRVPPAIGGAQPLNSAPAAGATSIPSPSVVSPTVLPPVGVRPAPVAPIETPTITPGTTPALDSSLSPAAQAEQNRLIEVWRNEGLSEKAIQEKLKQPYVQSRIKKDM